MGQLSIEMILLRQLAEYLSVPVFLVDTGGLLLYYNDSAEALLGQRFEETGPMAPEEWGAAFIPQDLDGEPLATEKLPLVHALNHKRPAVRKMRILGKDGVSRVIEVAAMPVLGQGGRFHGAVAMFWETA